MEEQKLLAYTGVKLWCIKRENKLFEREIKRHALVRQYAFASWVPAEILSAGEGG